MRDRVAEVLAERRSLQRGATSGIIVSIVLHGGLIALLAYSAMHAGAPVPASMVQIQFASAPAPASAPVARPARPKPVEAAPPETPKPEPKIVEPAPTPPEPPKATPEKNTVPLSPFGQSTKKGSETPATTTQAPPATAPAAPAGGATGVEIPVGGSGVTGLEGGDFPYTLYISGMQRRIGANWFRPRVAADAAAVIYFRILRDGTISEAETVGSSGNATFDRAALSAVVSSSPLNSLPPGYTGSWLGVHMTFR